MAQYDSSVSDLLDSGVASLGDPEIDEARMQFNKCAIWESVWRPRYVGDVKFAKADSDNAYQWPNSIRQSRELSQRPALTINVTRQHNLQIVNEMRKNKLEVAVQPTGNGATAEAANVLAAMIYHIQYNSFAQAAFTTAAETQIDGGMGYWRLVTEWIPGTFQQRVKILPIRNPLSVFMDPDIKLPDGSDARFAFVFEDVAMEEFRKRYPKAEVDLARQPLGLATGDLDLPGIKKIRVCEWFKKEELEDKLLSFRNENGEEVVVKKSRVPKEVWDQLKDDPSAMIRDDTQIVVRWRLIAGTSVLDETVWPGSYIPIVRCVGEETVIDGIMDRKGHTRYMKDSQRMLNYNASGQVEFVALQTKAPWTGATASFEGQMNVWSVANTNNPAVLPFNHLDADGNPLPVQALPRRVEPPTAAPGFQTGMDTAFNQMMMVSGQWQNQMGMQGNERTGAAIQQRQDEGDTATFHFHDNFKAALVYTGKQILELIPLVYDREQMIQVQGANGVDMTVKIDPAMQQVYMQEVNENNEVVSRMFNPGLGTYEVQAMTGEAVGTQREKTVQALSLILTQAPALTGVVGDLLLQSMDFKFANEAAMRLRRMVPPQALGTGPSENEQMLQQQLAQVQAALEQSLQKQAKGQMKLAGKEELREIEVYEAQTKRMAALAQAQGLSPVEMKAMAEDMLKEAAQTHLLPILQQHMEVPELEGGEALEGGGAPESDAPPHPGARKAPDGQWYLRDPSRIGKYMRIAPLAQQKAP